MKTFFGKIHKVVYSDEPAKINLKSGKIDVTQLVSDFICTKQKEWEYEDEYRVIHGDGPKRVHLGRDAILAVYFGAKTPKEDMDAVARAVLSNNATVKFFTMKPDGATWNLKAEESIFHAE